MWYAAGKGNGVLLKPRTICIDPECETNKEPDLEVGTCPVCAANGKDAKLIAHKNHALLNDSFVAKIMTNAKQGILFHNMALLQQLGKCVSIAALL